MEMETILILLLVVAATVAIAKKTAKKSDFIA